jgi:hypothetical protein
MPKISRKTPIFIPEPIQLGCGTMKPKIIRFYPLGHTVPDTVSSASIISISASPTDKRREMLRLNRLLGRPDVLDRWKS